jgi:hypothetical protein
MSGRTILLAGFGNLIPPGDLTIMFVVHSPGRTNSAIAEFNSAMAEFVNPNYSRIRIVVVAGWRESRYIESCKEIFYTDILRCDVTSEFFIFTERSCTSTESSPRGKPVTPTKTVVFTR